MSDVLYELNGVGKEFSGPGETLTVLGNVNLTVAQGESLAILGASGSGKTTLLHLLGTLDTPSWGSVNFRGQDLAGLDPSSRAEIRNRDIGFVFQFHHLLPEFSTVENVAMPAMIGGMPRDRALELAMEALGHVDLLDRADHWVTTLSGGERQRAAIARAIIQKPHALLADEPIGSLDEKTGRKVGELMLELNANLQMTLIVVTHNLDLADLMGRQLELHSGELHARA